MNGAHMEVNIDIETIKSDMNNINNSLDEYAQTDKLDMETTDGSSFKSCLANFITAYDSFTEAVSQYVDLLKTDMQSLDAGVTRMEKEDSNSAVKISGAQVLGTRGVDKNVLFNTAFTNTGK